MDPKQIGINTRNWVDSAQDRDYWKTFVNASLKLQVPFVMELVMLFVSRSLNLLKRTCISSEFSGRFQLFRSLVSNIFFASQILQNLYYFSSYSFYFRHVSLNDILKIAISSQNFTNPAIFATAEFVQKYVLFFPLLLLGCPCGPVRTLASSMDLFQPFVRFDLSTKTNFYISS